MDERALGTISIGLHEAWVKLSSLHQGLKSYLAVFGWFQPVSAVWVGRH